MDVRQARGSSEMESEIDWEEIDKHGADSEVEQYLMNNDQTRYFGELGDSMDVEAREACGGEQITRRSKGGI